MHTRSQAARLRAQLAASSSNTPEPAPPAPNPPPKRRWATPPEASPELPELSASELESLKNELLEVHFYSQGKCREMVLDAPGCLGFTYHQAALRLVSNENRELRAVGFWALARSLGPLGTVKVKNKIFSQRQLYCEAIRLDPNHLLGYLSLGSWLQGENATCRLADGRRMKKLDCIFEPIIRNPTYGPAYIALGVFVATFRPKNHTILLPDGRSMTEKQLYLEAQKCTPLYPPTYYNLGNMLFGLSPDQTLTLCDGRVLTQQQLYFEYLRLARPCGCPQSSLAYFEICRTLEKEHGAGTTFTLPDGRVLGQVGLLVEALRCDPRDFRCRDKLEKLLNPLTSTTPYFWSRSAHAVIFSTETNLLFTTLLLGLQRLEDTEVLPMTHQTMLEDMLEGWTWADSRDLKRLQ